MDNDAFLGRGWSFPPTFIKDKGLRIVAYEEDIRQSLKILFSTYPGERVHRYEYGCPLRKYAFEEMNINVMGQIRHEIEKAVILFEPRIDLESIHFQEDTANGILTITLAYTIIRTNKRSNMVYPFYLNEGTDTTR